MLFFGFLNLMIGADGRYIVQLLALALAFYVNNIAKVPREQPPGKAPVAA